MKTFVVALYNNFESNITMSFVSAEDKAKALYQVLEEQGFDMYEDETEEYYKQVAFDGDHAIEAIEI